MEISVCKPDEEAGEIEFLVLPVWIDSRFPSLFQRLDPKSRDWIQKSLKREDFKYKVGTSKLFPIPSGPARNLLIVGLGERGRWEPNHLRRIGAIAVRTAQKVRASRVTIDATALSSVKAFNAPQRIAEGVFLGDYTFDHYKTGDNLPKKTVKQVSLLVVPKGIEQARQGTLRGKIIAEAINRTRDRINIPASDMTPRRMVEEAKKIAGSGGISIRVMDRKACEKMNMGAFLAVAKGSQEPPFLIHLTYRPRGKIRGCVGLVGKGITFDSGGLSLKTAQGMETMKDDMSGAASVLSIVKAASDLKIPVEIHGIAAVTENMPSGSADKPGDVAKTMSGKTIEILNTDAEGRLTLADALAYAARQKPDVLIDLATLTGACVVALGDLGGGIMGNHSGLIKKILDSAAEAGEKLWQLPLWEEYLEDIKSKVADLKNIGGKGAGTITAGLFLKEFVDSKLPWAHVDIAGPAFREKESDLCPSGGTGYLVATLLQYLSQFKKP